MRKITPLLLAILSLIACNQSKKQDKNYLLKERSHLKTGVDFKNNLTEDESHSIINYIYFYNGGGVCAGDINNDGFTDLFFVSNQGYNQLYLNKGGLSFKNITEKANVGGSSDWNTGATFVDINNDGLLDIYVCAVTKLLDFEGQNELFINNGDGTFTEKAKEYGLDFKGYATQSYFFDYDKDGDLDVYIVNHAIHTNLSHGKASEREKRVDLVGDVLLQNNNGKFEDVSEHANIYGGVNSYGLSATIADFNNDGWDDIYVCNDFHEDDYYYINNKDGTFSEKLESSFSTISRFSMGSDAADINGDGFVDLITLDMLPNEERILKETEGDDAMLNMQINLKNLGYKDQYSRNMLQINNKGNYFYETALFHKVADTDWSWTPVFADFNNDGHQDLFISNGILRRPNGLDFKNYVSSTFNTYGPKEGLKWLYKSINSMPKGEVSNQIFKGNSKQFDEKTGTWIQKKPSLSNGAISVDLDNDGDLDLVTNNINDYASILENTTNSSKNYSEIQLHYKDQNKQAIGAKVSIYTNKKRQVKQLYTSKGFLSATESKLHFGLDSIAKIDSIKVIWPNQKKQVVTKVDINTLITINYNEDATQKIADYKKPTTPFFKKENLVDYKHQEDTYNDFFVDRLHPYKVSTLGPAVAIGDVDKNGYEDLFIGGASGKKAVIYLNMGTRFKKSYQKDLELDAAFEDNAASFFDADNDGDLDLYVASGIHTNRNRNFEIDRLYINENGVFKKSTKNLLKNILNASSVDFCDYDKDGDLDVFIGNLSNPDSFGATVNSAILVNDGSGNFSADPKFKLNSNVTDAIWVDVNNDQQKDLLIATEWDTPKVYINKNGVLELQKLPESLAGLWQVIHVFDVDSDGDLDIVLGNWGTNNRFSKYIENPMLLYFGDLDNNNKKESVIAFKSGTNYYPINSKGELASQMNMIQKKFVTHASFALQPMEKIFTDDALKRAKVKSIQTLTSGYLENNNGDFSTFKSFDDVLQMAPITNFSTFELDGKQQLLISGNSLKVNTYHGGYKALKGFLFENTNSIKPLSDLGIDPFNNQIKETAIIKMKNKKALFVIANNDSLKTYIFKN